MKDDGNVREIILGMVERIIREYQPKKLPSFRLCKMATFFS